jgi:hypothetical protein
MAPSTKSEMLFERFCEIRKIRFEVITARTEKTPDYNIYLDGTKIAVEVKEINPNLTEKENIKEFHRRKTVAIRSQLGKRVRDKITDAAGKFRDAAQDNCPSILILQNNVELHKHTEPADILAAMYGQLYFPVYGNPGETLSIGEMRSGPKKKMTPDSNTSISAVGVLQQPRRGDPDLAIYHNFHARAHLNPSLLLPLNIRQYQVNDPNNATGWVESKGFPL